MADFRESDSERQLRLVTDNLRVGIAHCDTEGRCKFVNRQWAERRCLTPEQVVGKSIPEVVGEERWAIFEHYFRECLAGKAIEFELEVDYPYRPGEPQFVHCCYEPEWKDGKVVGMIAAITNITALKSAGVVRHESEATFRAMFALDEALLGWWRYNPLNCMVSGDTRFRAIFDVTADEIAIEELMKRVHPDDAVSFWANSEAALDPTNAKPYAQEYRVRRRDGEIRWVESHGLAYFEGAGPERRAVSLTGTVQDMTKRKEREEMEYLLTREVNHRAKNMLSVVQVIAHHTAAKNIGDFIDRFSNRIQALSANQDVLVRNKWKGIEIEDLVRAQLAHVADLIGSRIAVQGPKLRLNPASAQTIGLAMHELATNAGKYGALSTDTGRVDIRWRTDGETFTMSWAEREGPPVSAPQQRGFGSVVMKEMAERSTDGKVDLEYAPSGVTWRLTCPAANALEPTV